MKFMLITILAFVAHASAATITLENEGTFVSESESPRLKFGGEVIFGSDEFLTDIEIASATNFFEGDIALGDAYLEDAQFEAITFAFIIESNGTTTMSVSDLIGNQSVVVSGSLNGVVNRNQDIHFGVYAAGDDSLYTTLWDLKVTSGGVVRAFSETFTSFADGSPSDITAVKIAGGTWQFPLRIEGKVESALNQNASDWLNTVGGYGVTPVPEPGTGALALLGGCTLLLRRRR